ncbi:unnamed protein product [Ixodes pacificus]
MRLADIIFFSRVVPSSATWNEFQMTELFEVPNLHTTTMSLPPPPPPRPRPQNGSRFHHFTQVSII